jgi:dTDP-4-amino-4,6-dideoxy-D-glucose acyltransferase
LGYLSAAELDGLGLKYLGKNVLISEYARIYNPADLSIGSNSRIDDFCLISAGEGGITLGRHVHISGYVSMVGQAPIVIEDFSGVSNKCAIFSSTDDYAAAGLIGPTFPIEFRTMIHREVRLRRFSTLGSNSVLLPGAILGEGTTVGTLSTVQKELQAWSLYVGSPPRRIRERPQGQMLEQGAEMLRRLGED